MVRVLQSDPVQNKTVIRRAGIVYVLSASCITFWLKQGQAR